MAIEHSTPALGNPPQQAGIRPPTTGAEEAGEDHSGDERCAARSGRPGYLCGCSPGKLAGQTGQDAFDLRPKAELAHYLTYAVGALEVPNRPRDNHLQCFRSATEVVEETPSNQRHAAGKTERRHDNCDAMAEHLLQSADDCCRQSGTHGRRNGPPENSCSPFSNGHNAQRRHHPKGNSSHHAWGY